MNNQKKYTFTQKDNNEILASLVQHIEPAFHDMEEILSNESIRRTRYKRFLRDLNKN